MPIQNATATRAALDNLLNAVGNANPNAADAAVLTDAIEAGVNAALQETIDHLTADVTATIQLPPDVPADPDTTDFMVPDRQAMLQFVRTQYDAKLRALGYRDVNVNLNGDVLSVDFRIP